MNKFIFIQLNGSQKLNAEVTVRATRGRNKFCCLKDMPKHQYFWISVTHKVHPVHYRER